MKALRVPKEKAEDVRKFAEKIKAKDKNRLIIQRGDSVEIPIYDNFEKFFPKVEIIEQKNPLFAKKYDLFEIVKNDIPEKLHKFIPKSYKLIGDIILIKIPGELVDYRRLIGEVLLNIHPRCKSVWLDRGKKGMLRKPDLKLLAGAGSETVHRENGCYFKLDVTKVMFSPGNLAERMRMSKIIRDGETVVDMFAGIGYFSIPIAVHSGPDRIYSIEINPDSYHFLLENIRLNNVSKIIPILGDSMYVTPENVADRVIMGHINCHEFLPAAFRALKDGGMIHYHESTPESILDRPINRIKSVAASMDKNAEIKELRKVKHYSPGVLHMVVDVLVQP
ncbi:MAG TPA: class I SAM-dependent methyltransferase family protein [Archaeoglobaceae archaeon]|nr:class I SAM-dependent methyltransferase family protein [Archaeoglobaceae archaeon]